ncbi:hypothetical protein [Magnetospirillum molischianum]|uniref:Uncharacterized protein n=1 Tax=Magnetospirillum molischianum DSM 120 TaxID=1150626 RepID=H8FY64_MAGML|nr:hypothetical protein [Magnetospirillum molischianum]CCG43302.1 hypothetical protein PHAMO_80093 [Magnetospirillum molischianum DSM 120]
MTTTEKTLGASYTWSSADFDYNDLRSSTKTWAEAAAWNSSVTETQAFAIAELGSRGVTKPFYRSLSVVDALNRLTAFDRKFSEAFTTASAVAKAFGLAISQVLAVAEIAAKTPLKPFVETFGVVVSYWKSIGVNPIEMIRVADSIAMLRVYSRVFDETLALAELGSRGVTRPIREAFRVVDQAPAKSFSKVNLETLGFAETYTDIIAFIVKVIESITISETPGKTWSHPVTESFGVSDTKVTKIAGLVKNETLTVAEAFRSLKTFYRALLENLGVTDARSSGVYKPIHETIEVGEGVGKSAALSKAEALAIADLATRASVFQREFQRTFSVSEAVRKTASLRFSEVWRIYDRLVRNANAVLSDVKMTNAADISVDDFDDLLDRLAPPGYQSFNTFVAGDYTFQKALVRHVLRTESSDRPRITTLRTTVDLPDVFDRGELWLNAVETTIPFNRVFNALPEVTVSLKAGIAGDPTAGITEFAVPRITEIGIGYFKVKLMTSAGTLTPGRVSWAAHGY